MRNESSALGHSALDPVGLVHMEMPALTCAMLVPVTSSGARAAQVLVVSTTLSLLLTRGSSLQVDISALARDLESLLTSMDTLGERVLDASNSGASVADIADDTQVRPRRVCVLRIVQLVVLLLQTLLTDGCRNGSACPCWLPHGCSSRLVWSQQLPDEMFIWLLYTQNLRDCKCSGSNMYRVKELTCRTLPCFCQISHS